MTTVAGNASDFRRMIVRRIRWRQYYYCVTSAHKVTVWQQTLAWSRTVTLLRRSARWRWMRGRLPTGVCRGRHDNWFRWQDIICTAIGWWWRWDQANWRHPVSYFMTSLVTTIIFSSIPSNSWCLSVATMCSYAPPCGLFWHYTALGFDCKLINLALENSWFTHEN